MHRVTRERGAATSIEPIVFRSLRREYRLHTPSLALRQSLLFMEATPEIVATQLEIIDIKVRYTHGFVAAKLPTGALVEGSTMQLISMLHQLMIWDHLESHGDRPIVHGASVIVDGKRLLLIGDKGLGKSTLSLSLLAAGYDVEGDEHVAIGEASVVARPRSLRVKPGTLALLPWLPDLSAAPSISTWDGVTVFAIAPSAFGRPWRIADGPLHAVVLLQPNWGGRSVAKRIDADQCFTALMANGHFGVGSSVLGLVGRFRALASRIPAFTLSVGDVGNAIWQLEQLATT